MTDPEVGKPTILTVILNYKTAEMTLAALEAAREAMEALSGEIVVVDNDSQDGSFETLSAAVEAKNWESVRVLQSGRNGGFGAGNNVGIQGGLSDGTAPDYVYILNSDAFPAKDAISHLLAYLEKNDKVSFVGSYIHGPDGEAHNTCFRFPSIAGEFEQAVCTGPISRLLKNHIIALPVPEISQKVDWLAGASLMMRRDILNDIGVFDERFFLYFEETDLCRRLAKVGGEVHFVRESKVEHIGSVSTGMKSWERTPQYWFQSRLYYFVKNHGRFYAGLTTCVIVIGGLLFKARLFLSRRKDPQAKPHFLMDLLRHDVGAVFSRSD